MANSCPYCAQTNTRKDRFGYCKKYNCFGVSGDKKKYESLYEELKEARLLPRTKRNQFDGMYYPYRKEVCNSIKHKIVKLLGMLPVECHELVIFI